MEIILAIVVGVAVIFCGALISMGNERQRRAIDDLREQVVRWAIQDLRIKHERLARDVRIDDPLDWLNKSGDPSMRPGPELASDGSHSISPGIDLYDRGRRWKSCSDANLSGRNPYNEAHQTKPSVSICRSKSITIPYQGGMRF